MGIILSCIEGFKYRRTRSRTDSDVQPIDFVEDKNVEKVRKRINSVTTIFPDDEEYSDYDTEIIQILDKSGNIED